jgi:type II secretory pathway component PulF
VLVKYKIQLPEALQLAADGVSDAHVRQLSVWLAEGTANGQTLSDLLTQRPRLPTSLIPLLRWGEKSGLLAEAFRAGREMFEMRVRVRSLLLQSILPPMLLIALGCTVGFFLIALFMPLIGLIQGLS